MKTPTSAPSAASAVKSSADLPTAAAVLGARGGAAGRGKSKLRGGTTKAQRTAYYRALAAKSNKAQGHHRK